MLRLRRHSPRGTGRRSTVTRKSPSSCTSIRTSSLPPKSLPAFHALEGVEKLEPAAAIEAYEAALRLYRGDLLDNPAVLNYRWMYDDEPHVALTFRSDYRLRHKEARLRLAELRAGGAEVGLTRAEELYLGLCAEDPDDERLWIALFRIHRRTGAHSG